MKTNRYRHPSPSIRLQRRSRQSGFTLIQIMLVLAIIAILSAIALTTFRKGRATAYRASCDVNVKAIAIALDAYRQENGHYPQTLEELVTKKYIRDTSLMRCPADPRPTGSYAEYYIPRAPRNEVQGRISSPPTLVCPLHERDGEHGVQAFTGLQTNQLSTKPAILTGANRATVETPGEKPIAAAARMILHGGDRIRTGAGGSASVTFDDGTICEIGENADFTLLQSYITGSSPKSPLYTLVHQLRGTVHYIVNHGSNFDALTPAATAGALGTEFTITVKANGKTSLYVADGKVSITTTGRMVLAPLRQTLQDLVNDVLTLPVLPSLGGLLGGLFG